MSSTSPRMKWLPITATVALAALKLSGHSDWPWWMVLSPLWIVPVTALFVAAAALVVIAWLTD